MNAGPFSGTSILLVPVPHVVSCAMSVAMIVSNGKLFILVNWLDIVHKVPTCELKNQFRSVT